MDDGIVTFEPPEHRGDVSSGFAWVSPAVSTSDSIDCTQSTLVVCMVVLTGSSVVAGVPVIDDQVAVLPRHRRSRAARGPAP